MTEVPGIAIRADYDSGVINAVCGRARGTGKADGGEMSAAQPEPKRAGITDDSPKIVDAPSLGLCWRRRSGD